MYRSRNAIELIFAMIFITISCVKTDDQPTIDTKDYAGNSTNSSYEAAKDSLDKIYSSIPRINSLYCSCILEEKRRFQLSTCSYRAYRPLTSKGNRNERAYRLEAEHIVPSSIFGGNLPEWKNWKDFCSSGGGRKCAEETENPSVTIKSSNGKTESLYLFAESDLYNLRFAVGEINGDRSNYPFVDTIVPNSSTKTYGSCEAYVDEKTFSPPKTKIRGEIARASLYMEYSYGSYLNFSLKPDERELFLKWNKKYPPLKEEISYSKRVEEIQGNENPFIINYPKINF